MHFSNSYLGNICSETVLKWQDPPGYKSTLVEVMVWCCQAISSTNVDQVLWPHVALPEANGLKVQLEGFILKK